MLNYRRYKKLLPNEQTNILDFVVVDYNDKIYYKITNKTFGLTPDRLECDVYRKIYPPILDTEVTCLGIQKYGFPTYAYFKFNGNYYRILNDTPIKQHVRSKMMDGFWCSKFYKYIEQTIDF